MLEASIAPIDDVRGSARYKARAAAPPGPGPRGGAVPRLRPGGGPAMTSPTPNSICSPRAGPVHRRPAAPGRVPARPSRPRPRTPTRASRVVAIDGALRPTRRGGRPRRRRHRRRSTTIGNVGRDEPLLADGEVHCVGEPYALVLADTADAAWRARPRRSTADWEVLPAILDARRGVRGRQPDRSRRAPSPAATSTRPGRQCATVVSGSGHHRLGRARLPWRPSARWPCPPTRVAASCTAGRSRPASSRRPWPA